MLLLSLKFKTGVCLRAGQRRCKRGNVRIHGVVAAVPGGFGRFSSAPEDGCHHTADLAAPLLRSGRATKKKEGVQRKCHVSTTEFNCGIDLRASASWIERVPAFLRHQLEATRSRRWGLSLTHVRTMSLPSVKITCARSRTRLQAGCPWPAEERPHRLQPQKVVDVVAGLSIIPRPRFAMCDFCAEDDHRGERNLCGLFSFGADALSAAEFGKG